MTRFPRIALLLLALSAPALSFATTPTPATPTQDAFRRAVAGHRVLETRMPAADGTLLQTFVYLPADGSGPHPTLVTRSPYDLPLTPVSGFPEDHPNEDLEASVGDVGWTEATDRGYALVIQFARGRYESDGTYSLLMDEAADGDALIRWVERQRWSNGRIGVFGDSAGGVLALQAAASGRASIRAVYAQATSPDFLKGVLFPERRTKWEAILPFTLSQSLDSSAAHEASLGLDPTRLDALKTTAASALGAMFAALEAGDASSSSWWTRAPDPADPVIGALQPRWGSLLAARTDRRVLRANDATRRIVAPVLHVSLWHDFFQESAFEAFERMQARNGRQWMLVLDGTHYEVDEPARWPDRPMFAWFDHWLKAVPNGVASWPRVRFAWASEGVQSIQASHAWPVRSRSKGVPLRPSGPTTLVADPRRPTPTLGGNHLIAPSGMLDQRPLLARPDVALLQGEASRAGTALVGRVYAAVKVDRTDLDDVVVKLVDVQADGSVRLIRETPADVRPDGIVVARSSPIAYRFAPGSRPGLLVAASSFPAFLPATPARAGTLRVLAGHLVLPEVDDDPQQASLADR